jgi:hypothetical protein
VLIYLIKNGSDKVVTSAREHLYDLKSLENFAYTDEQGKDQGINGNATTLLCVSYSMVLKIHFDFSSSTS